MSESDLRREFIRLTKPLDPWAIENMIGIGTPDVQISTGHWVELKWLRTFPARSSTPVRLPHYTDIQRSTLLRRYEAGGKIGLLLTCRTEWFFFDAVAAQKVGFLTKQELIDTATHYASRKPSSEELCGWFTT